MKVKITYFKRSGKFYTEAEECLPIQHAFEMGQDLRTHFKAGHFPGLSCSTWDGYAMVQEAPDGVPRLIDCCNL